MVDPYRYPSFRIDRVLLEEHSFRVIAFGGPFHDLREYARAGRGYLRVYRDFADRIEQIADSIAPEKQSIMTRSWKEEVRFGLILSDIKERERSQMEIAETLSKEVRKETLARAFVQQQSTFGGRRAVCLSNTYCRPRPWINCKSSCLRLCKR